MQNIYSYDSFIKESLQKDWIDKSIEKPGALRKPFAEEDEETSKPEIEVELSISKDDDTKCRRSNLPKTLARLGEAEGEFEATIPVADEEEDEEEE